MKYIVHLSKVILSTIFVIIYELFDSLWHFKAPFGRFKSQQILFYGVLHDYLFGGVYLRLETLQKEESSEEYYSVFHYIWGLPHIEEIESTNEIK
jgi:hypothetical protein